MRIVPPELWMCADWTNRAATAQSSAMSYTVDDLLKLLDLESIEVNIYRGRSRDIGSGRVFGGQVLAQSLVAAQRTVEPERIAHSVQGSSSCPAT
jgi:acyl-CoA thioesterase-2